MPRTFGELGLRNCKPVHNFLRATEADLAGRDLAWDAAGFPAEASIAGQNVPLEYAYAPGEEHDGITVKLPVALKVPVAGS